MSDNVGSFRANLDIPKPELIDYGRQMPVVRRGRSVQIGAERWVCVQGAHVLGTAMAVYGRPPLAADAHPLGTHLAVHPVMLPLPLPGPHCTGIGPGATGRWFGGGRSEQTSVLHGGESLI